MSALGLADRAMSAIRGATIAQHAIHKVRQGCGQGEVLIATLRDVLASDDQERLHGFLREIEKALERAA